MHNSSLRSAVQHNLTQAPIFAVVRTDSLDSARQVAETYIEGGLRLIEITFSVPDATRLVDELKQSAPADLSIGMGTVTTAERVEQALDVDADFIVTPNVSPAVADAACSAGRFLVLGALSTSEIVEAWQLRADLVKVYPLPPVGGPAYLEIVRQPLSDIPMLAAGGFGIDEIPAYRAAGAIAFGIGGPLLGPTHDQSIAMIGRAIALARGETTS